MFTISSPFIAALSSCSTTWVITSALDMDAVIATDITITARTLPRLIKKEVKWVFFRILVDRKFQNREVVTLIWVKEI